MTSSFKISDSLYLVCHEASSPPSELNAECRMLNAAVHHLVVIDCSGSMAGDLPRLRAQLKTRLSALLGPEDLFSCIAFSGRGQCITLFEASLVPTLSVLSDVHRALDRWLQPLGLTGFKEPLDEATRIAKHSTLPVALLFLSDGCDNQWLPSEIMVAVERTAGHVASTTIVEYGFYADRARLAAMAEKAGGAHIFSADFDAYAPTFERLLHTRPTPHRISLSVGTPIGGFVFALDDDLSVFSANHGTALVPVSLPVFSLQASPSGSLLPSELNAVSASSGSPSELNAECRMQNALSALYAALSLFSVRLQPKILLPILKLLGDVAFIDAYSGLFGKQATSDFAELAKAATHDTAYRLRRGHNPSRLPPDSAFTLLELFHLLSADTANVVLFDHPAFSYSRISRPRLDSELTPSLRFTEDLKEKAAGYPLDGLVWNETRPNLSFRVLRHGTVDLLALAKTQKIPSKIPPAFPTFQYRNRAVVQDGLVHVDTLPCRLTESTINNIQIAARRGGTPPGWVERCFAAQKDPSNSDVTLLDLKSLPILNMSMTREISALGFFTRLFRLQEARAEQKVFNAVLKELFPAKIKESKSFPYLYGKDGDEWLKANGFTDYGGFCPIQQTQAPIKDWYRGKELHALIAGLSSLPSLKEARAGITKGSKELSVDLMKGSIERIDAFRASKMMREAADPNAVLETWLQTEFQAARSRARDLIYQTAQDTFAMIVGQTGFKEFTGHDAWKLDFMLDKRALEGKAELKEIEIAI